MTEELARRLLEHLQHGTAHLGTIPDGFDIPAPPESTLVGSMVRGPEGDPDAVTAYFDSRADEDAIRAAVGSVFAKRGYREVVPKMPMGGGGFRHTLSPFGQSAMYCRGEAPAPYYAVAITPGEPTRVSVVWNSGLGMGWHPCAPQQSGAMPQEDIPSLSAPRGVAIQGGGGGGSPGAWYATGIAFTDLAPRVLLDHFATELESAGCTRLGREDADTAAWGRWKMPLMDYETIVGVVGAHPKMRLLLRYTFSPAQQDRQARMMGRSWTTLGSTRSYRV